jgi:hypothetical protein
MTNEALKITLLELNPSIIFDESGEWLSINIEDSSQWKLLSNQLRNDAGLSFDYLF